MTGANCEARRATCGPSCEVRLLALAIVVCSILPMVLAACGKTIGDTMDDATITTRVKTALLNDPDVNATRIDVSTAAGIVSLSGEVRSKIEADRAVQIVRGVPGVKDVRSTLKIGSSPTLVPPRAPVPRAHRSRTARR